MLFNGPWISSELNEYNLSAKFFTFNWHSLYKMMSENLLLALPVWLFFHFTSMWDNCGQQQKIGRSKHATPGSWPWQVIIKYDDKAFCMELNQFQSSQMHRTRFTNAQDDSKMHRTRFTNAQDDLQMYFWCTHKYNLIYKWFLICGLRCICVGLLRLPWLASTHDYLFFLNTEWSATNQISSLFQPIIRTHATWETIYS